MKDELHEEMDAFEPQRFDDRTGQPLDPEKVREGRAKEYEKLMQRGVCEPVLRTKARVYEREVYPHQVGGYPERRGREMPLRWSGVRCWQPKD